MNQTLDRILLSPPDTGQDEETAVLRALRSGWVTPAGPELAAFEKELAAATGRKYAVALASGTAAIHLAMLHAGVASGDRVLVPTLTFVASVNPVGYLGAKPVMIDCEPEHWNIDPRLVEDELGAAARRGMLPAAVVAVDLYGRCANYKALLPLCDRYGVPLIADAAEAMGASQAGRPAGSFGQIAAVSFNGNKIITTSGGGAIVTDDVDAADRIRYLSTQARQPVPHYEHVDVGYNYRLSNILAALGRAQLKRLGEFVQRRRAIGSAYREALSGLPGVSFPADDPGWNGWLSVILIDPAEAAMSRDGVFAAAAGRGIETRPAWKPMHRQPVYSGAESRLNGTADRVFATGLCLPSGSGMTEGQVEFVIETVSMAIRGKTVSPCEGPIRKTGASTESS